MATEPHTHPADLSSIPSPATRVRLSFLFSPDADSRSRKSVTRGYERVQSNAQSAVGPVVSDQVGRVSGER